MEKQFFLLKGNEKLGPLSLSELIGSKIVKTDLIWEKSLSDWKKAEEIPELEEYFSLQPPPTPFEKKRIESEKSSELYFTVIKSHLNSYLKTILIITVLITIGLNSLVYVMALEQKSSNHMAIYDLNPIYLTTEEVANPSSIFWSQLPTSFFMAFIISLLGVTMIYSRRIQKIIASYSSGKVERKTPKSSEQTIQTIKSEKSEVEESLQDNVENNNKDNVDPNPQNNELQNFLLTLAFLGFVTLAIWFLSNI